MSGGASRISRDAVMHAGTDSMTAESVRHHFPMQRGGSTALQTTKGSRSQTALIHDQNPAWPRTLQEYNTLYSKRVRPRHFCPLRRCCSRWVTGTSTSLPTIMQPTTHASPIYPHNSPSKIRRFSGLFKQSIRRCTSFTSSSVDTSAKSSAGGMVAMFVDRPQPK